MINAINLLISIRSLIIDKTEALRDASVLSIISGISGFPKIKLDTGHTIWYVKGMETKRHSATGEEKTMKMTGYVMGESYEGKNSRGESVSIIRASDIVGGWYLYVNGTLRDWADTKRELVRMQNVLWGVSVAF